MVARRGVKMRINIENEQKITEKLLNALERDDEATARRRLNDIRKQARNRYDYLRRRSEKSENLSNFERSILEQQLKTAQEEFEKVKKDVEIVRQNFRRPQNIRQAINRLNFNVAKNEQRKDRRFKEQSKLGRSISNLEIVATQKIEALVTNYFYNQKNGSGISKSDYEFINDALKTMGFDFDEKIKQGLSTLNEYGSDQLFDLLFDVAFEAVEIQNAVNFSQASDLDREKIDKAIDMLRNVTYM